MRVRMDYGKTGAEIEIPDGNLLGVLGLTHALPLANPENAIRYALLNPIGTSSLSTLAQGSKTVCIVICDITRPVPNSRLLPPILEILQQSGVPETGITLLIATGTHRPNLDEELSALVGPGLASRCNIVNHYCHDLDTHRFLGNSPDGIPVWLDKTYCDAELKITVGLIEPHFMAGYSGGRKLVMPGIAAMETIKRWHCPRFLESPFANNGIVENNPVHAASLAIARMMPPDLIMDVTLDETNRITGVFAGELEQAWLCGVDFAAQRLLAAVPAAADIVITSSAGYPLDGTFYQAVKGMVGALPVVKKGGTIVIASACGEGIGSPEFTRTLLETEDLEAFVAHISQPEVFLPEEWQIEELAKAVRHANIVIVTDGIDAATVRRCFVTPARTLEEGLQIAFARQGADAKVIAIPRGPYVIPHVIPQPGSASV